MSIWLILYLHVSWQIHIVSKYISSHCCLYRLSSPLGLPPTTYRSIVESLWVQVYSSHHPSIHLFICPFLTVDSGWQDIEWIFCSHNLILSLEFKGCLLSVLQWIVIIVSCMLGMERCEIKTLKLILFYEVLPVKESKLWQPHVLIVSSKVRNASLPKHRLRSRINLFLGFKIFVQFLCSWVMKMASIV